MHIKIFLPNSNLSIKREYKYDDDEYCIGVDKGALVALNNEIKVDECCGDFDSLDDEKQLIYIKKNIQKTAIYSSKKDDSDTAIAIDRALELNPQKISIFSEFSGRFDHTYALLLLAYKAHQTVSETILYGKQNKLTFLNPGTHEIVKSKYDYISFFAWKYDVTSLTLVNVEYPLNNYDLTVDSILCLSNAYISSKAQIIFSKGVLLCIESKDE